MNDSVSSDPPIVSSTSQEQRPQAIERQWVQDVYEAIGEHFSETRYKPWPLIDDFLASLPRGFIGLDAGCGNGKYLGRNSVLQRQRTDDKLGQILAIGLDQCVACQYPSNARSSRALCEIAHGRGHEVLHGDGMAMPWRDGVFDFAISIATIHHFASSERRRQAVQSILRALNPRHGRMLIQVWALEQGDETTLLKGKGRQTEPLPGGTDERDVLVPWKLQRSSHQVSAIHHRYYRLFKEGELLELVQAAASELGITLAIERCVFERGNWLLEARLYTT